tara:strand:+ start:129 stop:680 length:552 start_codon:yes stop_codon:yes gene_type:complete
MKDDKIVIEDGIDKDSVGTKNFFDDETKKALDSMKVGQSFTVKKYSQRAAVFQYGRRTGKLFSSKKIYEGTRKGSDSPHYFRIWLERGKPKPLPDQKKYQQFKVKDYGSLTKADVTDKVNSSNDQSVPNQRLAQGVLELAELRAENRKIVEDLEHIKRILKEELGEKGIDNWKPVKENDEDLL